MNIPKETLLKMHRQILIGRRLSEKTLELFSAGKSGMPWFHDRRGEEAIPVAVCANLRKNDYLKLTFANWIYYFAKGLPLMDVIGNECLRDFTRKGEHHNSLINLDYGILGWSGTLGEDVPVYTGAALSAKLRKTDQVTVCIIGDGTASRGPVHESMVLAAAWNLPIVFIIQNNQYGEGTPVHKIYKIKDISDRAKAYGFPGQTVDGNDVIATYEVVKEYVNRARSGGGPGLIVTETYRLVPHWNGDDERYRPKGEVEEWWKKDPLPRYQKQLMEMGLLSEKDVINLEKEIRTEIDEATEAMLALPPLSYDEFIKFGCVAEL